LVRVIPLALRFNTNELDAGRVFGTSYVSLGRFAETALTEPDLIALHQLCRYRFSLVDNISDLKRQVITLLDQVFPEYENLFSDLFGASSKEMLASLTTPEEFLAVDTNRLAEMLR
jgi:transposase